MLLCAIWTLGACSDEAGRDGEAPETVARDPARSTDAAAHDAALHDASDVPPPGPPRLDASASDAGSVTHDAESTNADSGDVPAPTPAGDPVFVAVGYAGIRVRSTDLGLTWRDAKELGGGGDDEFLLRGVTFGAGQFVATGYRILTSPDGDLWSPHDHPQRQWLGGVVFAEDTFVAVGGYGYSVYSQNGANWTEAQGRGTTPARGLAHGDGSFVAATDNGTWYGSPDGRAWSVLSAGHRGARVVFCGDAFREPDACTLPIARSDARSARGAGVYVSITAGGMAIERSTDGVNYQRVYDSPRALEAVAFGAAE